MATTSRTVRMPNGTEFFVDLLRVEFNNQDENIYIQATAVHKTNYNITNVSLFVPKDEFDAVGRAGVPGGSVNLQDAVMRVVWAWIAANIDQLVRNPDAVVV